MVATNPINSHGLVVLLKNGANLNTNVISDATLLGATWLRAQFDWSDLEPTLGSYQLANVDDAVRKCNKAGINIMITVQKPAAFHLTVACGLNGLLPGVSDTVAFASMLALRYNGITINSLTGKPYGKIQCLGLNEDWDDYQWGLPGAVNYSCRDFGYVVPILQQLYPYVKSVNPDCLVSSPALLGKRQSVAHITQTMTNFHTVAGGATNCVDFVEVHYYPNMFSSQEVDTTANGGPTLPDRINAVKACNAAAGRPNLPIWINEFNWLVDTVSESGLPSHVTQAVQSAYLIEMLEWCRLNGIATVMWYSIEQGTEDSSLSQAGGGGGTTYLQAFYDWQSYIRQVGHDNFQLPSNPLPPGTLTTGM